MNIRNQLERFLVRFASSSTQMRLDAKSSVVASEKGKRSRGGEDNENPSTGLYANLARYDETTMTYKLVNDAKGGKREVYAHPISVFFQSQTE